MSQPTASTQTAPRRSSTSSRSSSSSSSGPSARTLLFIIAAQVFIILLLVILGALGIWPKPAGTDHSGAAAPDSLRATSPCAQGRLVGEYLRRTQTVGPMLTMPKPLSVHDVHQAELACTDTATATLLGEQGAALGIQLQPPEEPAKGPAR